MREGVGRCKQARRQVYRGRQGRGLRAVRGCMDVMRGEGGEGGVPGGRNRGLGWAVTVSIIVVIAAVGGTH